ncbi:MAG: AtpZ/AtpI family protein [Planctomycetota bacterium]
MTPAPPDPPNPPQGDPPPKPAPAPPPNPPSRGGVSRFRNRFFGLTDRPPDPKPADAHIRQQRRLATAGLEFAGGILLFAALGYGVDTLLRSTPIGVVVGALLGMAGGLYRLIQAAQPPKR